MSLHMELEHRRRTLIVRLKGELDHHAAESVKVKMEEAIARGDIHHVVFNMKQLEFMDSSGLGVILGRYKQIAAKGGKVVVCDVRPAVHRLLEMSGMFKILTAYDDERMALSGLEVVS